MTDYLNSSATLTRLEPFLLIAKSAKGAAAAKLVQDAISAPGVFVFAELLETPNIQELEKSEQHKGWLEILKLFSYGTYQDYKARASTLPKLTLVQETKLKYLSLATLTRNARILPYSQLQEALDTHAIRDLEDLIIDAMYQDVLRGKLDQRRSTFEVEWAMGRDMIQEDIRGLLEALNNWSRMTGALLGSMDKKIKKIKDEQIEGETLRNKQNALLRENIKEVAEKIQPPAANRAPRKGRIGESSTGDAMDVDDRGASGPGPRNPGSSSSGMRIQEQVEGTSKLIRKRYRGA